MTGKDNLITVPEKWSQLSDRAHITTREEKGKKKNKSTLLRTDTATR